MGYHVRVEKIADIDVLGDGPFQRRVLLLCAGLALGALTLAVGLAAAGAGEKLGLGWWVALAAGLVVPLPAHELVHAAGFRLLCPGCRVGFGFEDGFLYTRANGAVAARWRFVTVLLAPAVLVTAGLAALALWAGWPVLATLVAGAHLAGCAGDMLMAAEALREPACTHVRDTESGIALLCASREARDGRGSRDARDGHDAHEEDPR